MRVLALLNRSGMLLVLGLLVAGCWIGVSGFGTPENAMNLLLQVSTVGIVATTMLYCIASGNIDLSVGTLIPCGGVLCALVLRQTGNVALAIAAALAFGALVGLLNGIIVAKFRINALITTLSTMMMVKGTAFVFADGKSIGIADQGLLDLANGAFPIFHKAGSSTVLFQVTTPVWICLGLFGLFGFIIERTTFGRNTLAIGGNPEAARLAGVKVEKLRVWIFLLQGLVAGLAGLILASRITSGQPNAAQGFELDVISACVLGGVSLQGGRARIFGVLIGVLIMGTVENVMNLLDVDAFYQYLMRGLILLAAVLLDQLKTRGGRGH